MTPVVTPKPPAREVIARLRADNTALRQRVADLEAELRAAYVTLTRAHVCERRNP